MLGNGGRSITMIGDDWWRDATLFIGGWFVVVIAASVALLLVQ